MRQKVKVRIVDLEMKGTKLFVKTPISYVSERFLKSVTSFLTFQGHIFGHSLLRHLCHHLFITDMYILKSRNLLIDFWKQRHYFKLLLRTFFLNLWMKSF